MLSRQTRVCRDKIVVATKMILVAATASDIIILTLPAALWQLEGRVQSGNAI